MVIEEVLYLGEIGIEVVGQFSSTYICSTRFLHRAMGSKYFKMHRSNCCVPVYNIPADSCSDLSHMAKLSFVIVHQMMPSSSVSAFQKLTTQAFSAIY